MGAVPGDEKAGSEEKPRHHVTISKGFWLARTPVTVAAYKRFVAATKAEMPDAPDFNPRWQKESHPVVRAEWSEISAFDTFHVLFTVLT